MRRRIFAWLWRHRLGDARVVRVLSWRSAIVDDKGIRYMVMFWEIFDHWRRP